MPSNVFVPTLGPHLRLGASRTTLWNSLIAAYALDAPSGQPQQDSSKLNPSLSSTNGVTQTTGKVGFAAQLANASQQYLQTPDTARLSAGASLVAGSIWTYLDSKTARRVLASKGASTGATGEFNVDYRSVQDRFSYYVGVGGAAGLVDANTLGSPSLSTWYHLYWQYDGTNVGLSVNNGTLDTAASTGLGDSADALTLGSYSDATNILWCMDGRLWQFMYWKGRILTAAERAFIYNNGAGRSMAALLGI